MHGESNRTNRDETIKIAASDGYELAGRKYLAHPKKNQGKILIINSATAVDKKLYHHYASYMADHGYNVITYDYRGIANSRPKKLRGFKATWTDWGKKDFEGVINFVKSQFSGQKMLVLGHSIGGVIPGLTWQSGQIKGMINIGAQAAYYKDWPKKQRVKLYLLWHIIFPMLTKIFGYLPGKRLNLLEDVPKGVIAQWHARRLACDITVQFRENKEAIFYNNYYNKLLTLGIEDDPIGTERAIMRIHDLFTKSAKKVRIIDPNEVQTDSIGHFGFFRRKFKHTLWNETLAWYDKI